jgi:hypothetical protein
VPLGLAHSAFLAWPDADQDKALGFLREQRQVCTCGTRRDEWERDRFAYVAEQYQCPGCELLEMERAQVPEHARGVKVFLVPKPPDADDDSE